ncbi:MAG: thioether cross-link-forming SCIFF peptide maturase [Filifactoraceae bacterium]
MRLIHKFKQNDMNFVVDVNTGSIHLVDEIVFKVLDFFDGDGNLSELDFVLKNCSGEFSKEALKEAYDEVLELKNMGLLFSEDNFAASKIFSTRKPVVKALCLHMAHDCNLRCKYCFASQGDFNGPKGLMSFEVGKASIDYLLKNSGSRKNLEVDFFGGEPLMNFDVVKRLVDYGNEKAKESGKIFRFTITTNGVLLDEDIIKYINENMHNVVLSLDGREEINNAMRPTINNKGSYEIIVPKYQKLIEGRKNKFYYIRGTFTRNNMNFGKDVMHFKDLGFKLTSMEPVVDPEYNDYALRSEDIPAVLKAYEDFALDYLNVRKKDENFKFFHYMIDLSGGPCAIKRITGCGAALEYLAITPEGDIYPCHQFVGKDEYKMGNILEEDKDFPKKIIEEFSGCNVETKESCQKCWAKFYCSGGCHANAKNFNGDIMKPYEDGCLMQKKRIECAIMVETALRLQE